MDIYTAPLALRIGVAVLAREIACSPYYLPARANRQGAVPRPLTAPTWRRYSIDMDGAAAILVIKVYEADCLISPSVVGHHPCPPFVLSPFRHGPRRPVDDAGWARSPSTSRLGPPLHAALRQFAPSRSALRPEATTFPSLGVFARSRSQASGPRRLLPGAAVSTASEASAAVAVAPATFPKRSALPSPSGLRSSRRRRWKIMLVSSGHAWRRSCLLYTSPSPRD